MAALVPCLVALRDGFDAVAPARATGSDGWIGDAAHAMRVSDHNPDSRGLVHAIDVTKALNESDLSMEKCVQFTLARCRSGAEHRLTYMIFDRRIWSAGNQWRQSVYRGSDPHTGHAHFSASNQPGHEQDRASWHLEDIPVALTQQDKSWLSGTIRSVVNEIVGYTTGDVVPRWSDDGAHVAADDPNQFVTLRDAGFYIGATAKRVENGVLELLARTAADSPPPPPAVKGR